MIKILLLCLILISPGAFAKPLQVGYVYLPDLGKPITFMIEEKSKLKGKEFYDIREFVQPSVLNSLDPYDPDFEEECERFVMKFVIGNAALTFADSDYAIYLDIVREPNKSLIWKYLDISELELAYGFINLEWFFYRDGWPQNMIDLLKQNERVQQAKAPYEYDPDPVMRVEAFHTSGEQITITKNKYESRSIIGVFRDDKEAVAAGNILRDSLFKLDTANENSNFLW